MITPEYTIDIEARGAGGFGIYRIPSVVVTAKGTVLLSYECRLSLSDWDTRAVALKISRDGGKSFGERLLLAEHDSLAVNNPVLTALRDGRIIFLYQLDYLRTFIRISDDDGYTFSPPREITAVFDSFRGRFDHNVCATGPGHGVELESGRIVVPVWLAYNPQRHHNPSVTAVIASDDRGESWIGGDVIFDRPDMPSCNETCAAEMSDGRVIFNLRHHGDCHRRAISYSPDGLSDFTEPVFDNELRDPGCFASMCNIKARGFIAYCGCDDTENRENLTLRLSRDDSIKWFASQKLYDRAGYSDIAPSRDGGIYVFFERDELSALSLMKLRIQ